MLLFLGVMLVYVVGGFISYYLAYYFGWDSELDGEDALPVSVFALLWFLGLPVLLILTAGDKLRETAKDSRKKKEQKIKLRIAEEKRQQQLLQESEQEVEKYVESLSRKNG